MLRKKYPRNSLIILVLISSFSWTQFIDVHTKIDLRRVNEGDKQIFETLAEDIEKYFLNTIFSPEAGDLELVIDISFIVESISQGGSQTTVSAQAIFSNKSDQYFYAKGIQFPYSKARKMYFTSSFDPIVSFLDYYAFMFIASELDTWDYMGGSSFFNRAIELSNSGKDSDWSSGWDDRWKKSRKLKNNQYLRSMRFNYFAALDALSAEEVDINIVKFAMDTFYEDLILLDKKLGSNKETLHFLKAYHESIAELLAALQNQGCLELLMLYDHDHKKVYKSFLKS